MDPEAITRAYLAAVEAKDWEAIRDVLAEDFQFSGPVPEPMNREQFIGLSRTLSVAFPDWSYNLEKVEVEGDTAVTTHQITGTHQGDLDLSGMGMPTVPPTGRAFRMPVEHAQVTVKEGRITRMHVDVSPGGGLRGVLAQIGLTPPQ